MELTIIAKNRNTTGGYLEIDDAEIIWPNFSGRTSQYNPKGDKEFTLKIPTQEIADALINDVNEDGVGWNVKIKPPREEGDTPFMHMNVKVSFNARGPEVVLITDGRQVQLDEESIGCLDNIDIERVDMNIRSYDDVFAGRPFRSAYLDRLYVVQKIDRFIERYGVRD